MFKLKVTELAYNDLDGIVAYIAVQLSNPKAAAQLLDDIEKCYHLLRTNPEMYEACRDDRLLQQGYRKALVSNYLLIYKIEEQSGTVYILRVFYGARDYIKLI
jgi:plasmid stabilization system protein ParE